MKIIHHGCLDRSSIPWPNELSPIFHIFELEVGSYYSPGALSSDQTAGASLGSVIESHFPKDVPSLNLFWFAWKPYIYLSGECFNDNDKSAYM